MLTIGLLLAAMSLVFLGLSAVDNITQRGQLWAARFSALFAGASSVFLLYYIISYGDYV